METDPGGLPRSGSLLEAQSEVIDVIAAGTNLHETLRRVALIVEALAPPAICSVLLVDPDGLRLRNGAAPNLPDSYNAAVDGIAMGPAAGSCGTAAFLRRTVIVQDIAVDPLWEGHRALPLSLGLRACWSQPIIDSGGAVLGTFALYYREPKAPAAADLDLVDRMSRLVRVALIQDRRERVLVEAQQKLRDYVSLSSDWVWERFDGDHQFVASNDAVRYDGGALRANPAVQSIIQDLVAQVRDNCGAELAAGRSVRNVRASFTAANGEPSYFNINVKPILGENGQVLGHRGTAQNITAQVAAEAESHRLKIEAQDASRAKTEFLANISHELRTPLNAILGFSEIMQEGIVGPLSDRYRQYAADIHRSGQHLHALVTDVLNLSRIEMGRIDLDEEVVQLSELVQACINMLRIRAIEQGVQLTVELAPDLASLRCDRLRLMQALLNLVSNSVKFTPKFGVVTISSVASQDGVALVVRDTGIGMRPEDIPRALEPFRQINPQLNRSYEGVGLGLALAKSLVELHGGRLELVSAPGEGTTATIRLPASRMVGNQHFSGFHRP